jgi:SOS-response transcriptional repressor LexA
MLNRDRVAESHPFHGIIGQSRCVGECDNPAEVVYEVTKGRGLFNHLGTRRTVVEDEKQDKSYPEEWSVADAMKNAGDRLRALRVKRGFSTASDAAKAYGWNEHTYKSHENGIRGIRPDAARKYASAFGSTPAHILGIGPENGNGTVSNTLNHVNVAPLVARVSAGVFRYDEGLEEGAIIQVPVVPRKDIPAQLQYAVLVDGPSVNLRIADGAYAICAPYESYPGGAQHGQLVHVVRERSGLHEHTIKELRFTREGLTLAPCSSDPRYQEPIVLATGEAEELVRIQGVVIGMYQPL